MYIYISLHIHIHDSIFIKRMTYRFTRAYTKNNKINQLS